MMLVNLYENLCRFYFTRTGEPHNLIFVTVVYTTSSICYIKNVLSITITLILLLNFESISCAHITELYCINECI